MNWKKETWSTILEFCFLPFSKSVSNLCSRECWAELLGAPLLERLVASLPRRMEMVIAAKGGAIDRWKRNVHELIFISLNKRTQTQGRGARMIWYSIILTSHTRDTLRKHFRRTGSEAHVRRSLWALWKTHLSHVGRDTIELQDHLSLRLFGVEKKFAPLKAMQNHHRNRLRVSRSRENHPKPSKSSAEVRGKKSVS